MTRAGVQSSTPALFYFEKLLNDFIYTEYHCLLRSNPERVEMDRHTCIQKVSFILQIKIKQRY